MLALVFGWLNGCYRGKPLPSRSLPFLPFPFYLLCDGFTPREHTSHRRVEELFSVCSGATGAPHLCFTKVNSDEGIQVKKPHYGAIFSFCIYEFTSGNFEVGFRFSVFRIFAGRGLSVF